MCAQGSKREQQMAEKRASGNLKKWNHGAPLSKKSMGVGRFKGKGGKFCAADSEQRDPQLPSSVPMPSAVEDINHAGMRAMWEQSAAMDGEAPLCVEPLD